MSQLELIKVLVYGKVCFNLIKLSLGFSFLVFLPVSGQLRPKKIALSVGVRDWVSFRVRARIGGKFSSEAIILEPFLPVEKKESFCMRTKC